MRNIAFKIETPNPARWGVLQSLVAAGEITTAIVSGVATCKIDVISDTDPNTFAEATAADFTKLQIRDATGIAQILWRAGGTGTQWAVVRIGNASSGVSCSERLEKFVMLSNWNSGLAVARFWFAGVSTGSGGTVGIVEDELLIFDNQLSYGKWCNSILDCNGRHFVIQAKCAQATVVPSDPIGACILSPGDGGGCFQLSESDCEAMGGTWTLGDPCP
ncbi:MAG TPA: hypothetical protein VM260_13790 [Pirellula sp.]|nr:hypothetical protein [Pirellula sp.]